MTAPVGVVLSSRTAVEPDVLFISRRRTGIAKGDLIRGAPDLVVEVVSPSTAVLDRGRKRRAYEAGGVREQWVADPFARVVEVHAFGKRRRARLYAEGDVFPIDSLPRRGAPRRRPFRRDSLNRRPRGSSRY